MKNINHCANCGIPNGKCFFLCSKCFELSSEQKLRLLVQWNKTFGFHAKLNKLENKKC
jgi:hypothetical protein